MAQVCQFGVGKLAQVSIALSQAVCSAMSGRLPACAMHAATPCASLRKQRRERQPTQTAKYLRSKV